MSSNWSLLVVEDEPLIAMLLVDLLDELGCTVAAQASSVAEGLDRANGTLFDAAILDVSFRGQPVWPLADALQGKGIRFALATGYDGRQTQRRYPSAAVLAKPYALENLRQALDALRAFKLLASAGLAPNRNDVLEFWVLRSQHLLKLVRQFGHREGF